MSEAPTPPPATIIGTGMITPIGLHTAATEAALRAGIARIEELEPAEGEELGRQGAKIPPEALGIEGEVQASEWAAVALAEACTQAEENVSTWSKVAFCLALPAEGTPEGLSEQLAASIPATSVVTNTFRGGSEAGFEALATGLELLGDGKCAVAIVGAIDVVDGSDRQGVIGEGAAFVVLHAKERAGAVRVIGATTQECPADEPPQRADTLTEVLTQAKTWFETPPGLAIWDANGERARAIESSVAWNRVFGEAMRDEEPWFTADKIGETGAAAALIHLCWAATTLEKKRVAGKDALIWGGSKSGRRGACGLARSSS